MTTKPSPTETRVRAALLRLWERHVADHVDDAEWHWLPIDVRDEVIADGQTRLQMRTVQGAGLDVSGGWYALGGGAEYTYERGVFRVRKRAVGKRNVFSDRDPGPPAHLLAKPDPALDSQPSESRVAMSADDVLAFVEQLLRFPYPQVCRHYVAAQLLSELERLGLSVSRELADAVVGANDAEAIRLLAECRTSEPKPAEPRVTQRQLDVPELPPGYRVGPCDDAWIIGDDDCWFDDDDWGAPLETREDAVARAWEHFNFYGDSEWVKFIEAIRKREKR